MVTPSITGPHEFPFVKLVIVNGGRFCMQDLTSLLVVLLFLHPTSVAMLLVCFSRVDRESAYRPPDSLTTALNKPLEAGAIMPVTSGNCRTTHVRVNR